MDMIPKETVIYKRTIVPIFLLTSAAALSLTGILTSQTMANCFTWKWDNRTGVNRNPVHLSFRPRLAPSAAILPVSRPDEVVAVG